MMRPLVRRPSAVRRSAFTLLEVLVVVAILVILAGISSIYVFRYLEDAKKDKARIECKQLEKSVKAWSVKNGGDLPENLDVLIGGDGGSPMIEGGQDALRGPWGNPYVMRHAPGAQGDEVIYVHTTDGSNNIFPPAPSMGY